MKEEVSAREVLACIWCYKFLKKLNTGEFTINQIAQHFSRKYKTVYVHITALAETNLVEKIVLKSKAGKFQRLLFTSSTKGRLALMEKGDISDDKSIGRPVY